MLIIICDKWQDETTNHKNERETNQKKLTKEQIEAHLLPNNKSKCAAHWINVNDWNVSLDKTIVSFDFDYLQPVRTISSERMTWKEIFIVCLGYQVKLKASKKSSFYSLSKNSKGPQNWWSCNTKKNKSYRSIPLEMGLEPTTLGLEGRCSIHWATPASRKSKQL